VLRAAALDGRTVSPGGTFSLHLHLFDPHESLAAYFTEALRALAWHGLGPRRPRVDLIEADCARVVDLDLAPRMGVGRIKVKFLTPVALKDGGTFRRDPDFAALAARARDRVGKLREIYQDGKLAMDFRGYGERARMVRLVRADVVWRSYDRESQRTGQVQALGGFVGEAEYEGELGEFVPFLEAGFWTGVGSQTVWGFGAISVETPIGVRG
jgi:hypothetical protein